MEEDIKPLPDENNKKHLINPDAYDNAVIKWTALDHLQYERGKMWYLCFGLITFFLIFYAFFTSSWSMAVVFIVLAGVYLMTHQQKPRVIEVKISELGIKAGRKMYPFSQMNFFWIIYKPPRITTLNLKMKKGFESSISIQLGMQDPGEVRNFLLNYVNELEGKDESLSDVFTHLFRL